MLGAILVTALLIVALDRHNTAKHYKECYEQMKDFYNDVADDNCRLRIENCRLRVKYGLSSTFSDNNKSKD